MSPEQKPQNGVCYQMAAPVLDGKANAAWAALPPRYLNDWRTGAKPKAATWFKLGYDATHLYLLARCEDPNVAAIKATSKQGDTTVYADDCIELHISFDPVRNLRYQLDVNSKGVTQSIKHTLNEGGADVLDLDWKCEGLKAAASVDAAGWTVEMAVPFSSIGGTAKEGEIFAANIARAVYSGGDGIQPVELQAWSATTEGFADGRYFGKFIMSNPDASATWFNEQTPPPNPVLFKVDKDNPWTVVPGAIKAVADRDSVHYDLQAPQVDKKGRVYAGFSVKIDPALDPSSIAGIEMAYTKTNPDVMLELLFYYTAADGKNYSGYWLPSQYGDGSAVPQLFLGRFKEANLSNHPAPVKINSVTVYAVIEGAKTPASADFSMQWIRLTKDSLVRGEA